jgi:transcriptional regulator with XRE-family HTH domain
MTATNESTTYPMETTYLRQPPQQPLRHLDPAVARSIADAKTRTGLSWRRLAALTGVSHPHLVLLAQGKRVPSMVTADRIISVLPLTADEQDALRGVAVGDRGKSRPRR